MSFASIDALIDFLAGLAHVPSVEAEGFTELDHGLQCAAELAQAAPGEVELQVAGLVHDVAHTLGPIADHGPIGAQAVRELLGERVAALVEAHVPAKRWLVTVDPSYRARLSPDSIRSLVLQGGSMTPEEVAGFDAVPHARDAVLLRRADDAAKVPGRVVPGLEAWTRALRAVAATHRMR